MNISSTDHQSQTIKECVLCLGGSHKSQGTRHMYEVLSWNTTDLGQGKKERANVVPACLLLSRKDCSGPLEVC